MIGGDPFFGDFQWRMSSLSIKVGELGLYLTVEASRAQT